MPSTAPRRVRGPSALAAAVKEVRLVGRGGQGIVTAGELVGEAVILGGRHAQALPTFGPERRGAMAASTLRVCDAPILLKCSTASPRMLVCLDPTIWRHAPVTLGLQAGAALVVNTTMAPDDLERELRSGAFPSRLDAPECTVHTLDATGIALRTLGRPISNTTMLGAMAGASDIVTLAEIEDVLRRRFGAQGEANVAAARAGYEAVVGEGA
jgi:pyruvate ferredoxin oxidoreductase gamma subunit